MMLHIAAKYAEQRNISLSPKLLRKFADAPGPSLIIPRLYLGDFADAGNLKLLENLKITHVVSVIERQPWPLHKTRLNKLHINIHDEATSDILTHLDHTTQYITEALRNPESIVMVSFLFMHNILALVLINATRYTASKAKAVVRPL